MQYYRDRTRRATAMIEDVKNKKTVEETQKAFRKSRKGLQGAQGDNRLLLEDSLDDDDDYSRFNF